VKILDGLEIESVGIFYGSSVCFMAPLSVLRPFGIFYGHLVYLPRVYLVDSFPFRWSVCCLQIRVLKRIFFSFYELDHSWGRCYDQKFLRFFDNYRRKNWRFSQKTMF
jgi:hypothetical protein